MGGRPAGLKLLAIDSGSFFSMLGFGNGDVIQKVNGNEILNADAALALIDALIDNLENESDIQIQVERGAMTQILELPITPSFGALPCCDT